MSGVFALLFLAGAVILWATFGIATVKVINWHWVRRRGRPFFHPHDSTSRVEACLVVILWPLVWFGLAVTCCFEAIGIVCEYVGSKIIGGE